MDIARPKAGFKLREPGNFAEILRASSGKWPRAESLWDGVKERLKITAHREGAGIAKAGYRVFEAQGDSDSGLPGLRVAYHVLGDTVTFLALEVLEPEL
jgi:hypothetical protein